MNFKKWLTESIWYHGTKFGDDIRNSKQLQVSTSGGGQRGLLGVWFTKDKNYANVYANVMNGSNGQPELLRVEIPDNLKIADLDSVEKKFSNFNDAEIARWKIVGIDIMNKESSQIVRDLQPYALTKLLIKQGYDGAYIPNTIHKNGERELVIFDPKKAKILNV